MSNKIFLIYPLVAVVVILSWKSGKKSVMPGQVLALFGIGLLLSLIAALPLLRAISLEPGATLRLFWRESGI